jgi:hypothetical protein
MQASSLNHCEFVELVGETESEHRGIIKHTHVRWLGHGYILKESFRQIKLFMERNNKRNDKLHDEGG